MVLLGVFVFVGSACAAALAPVPAAWSDGVFLGCWMSIVASAAIVHRRRALKNGVALALSLNAGVWSGAVIALSPSRMNLLEALPAALCAWPAAWVRRQGQAIVLKVLASWLIAIAVLGATLQFLPVTPGYLPDHVD
ncbi:MAG TPA: hypothetical protein VMA54_12795 [Steroidobacteraceae bacterium]|nr:hypothetical protein [Steroidobacteraceae bacterium]